MPHLIEFTTSDFDVAAERPNPTNPIAGAGLLEWLRAKLSAAGYSASETEPEDWGWLVDVEGDAGSYRIGASGEPGGPGSAVDWVIQVHRRRSLWEKLTGRNELAPDDPLTALVEGLVRAEAGFREVSVQRLA